MPAYHVYRAYWLDVTEVTDVAACDRLRDAARAIRAETKGATNG